ncbi:MAG: coiled coil domain-containing protein [Candidatus Omnitrophota bacterium]
MSEELKKAYQEKAEAQLKEWGSKLEELKNKTAKLSADAKIKVIERIEDLKKRIKEGSENLNQLKNSSESNWEILKAKIEGTAEGIKKGIEDIMSKL